MYATSYCWYVLLHGNIDRKDGPTPPMRRIFGIATLTAKLKLPDRDALYALRSDTSNELGSAPGFPILPRPLSPVPKPI